MKRSSSNPESFSNKREKFQNGGTAEVDCFTEAAVGESPLPDELLAEIIFQFIPLCQWSSRFEFVSKQFQHCIHVAYSRVKSINFRKFFSLNQSMGNYKPQPNRILHKSPEKMNNILMKLISVCPNLTEMIGFKEITTSLESDTWNILKKFHRLESISLNIVKFQFQDFADFVTNCKSLKILNVKNCSLHFADDSGVLDIGSLTSIALYNNRSNMESGFRLKNFSEKLTSLQLDGFQRYCWRSGDTENLTKNCSNLETISVRLYNEEDYKIFSQLLPHFSKLISLNVIGDIYVPINDFHPKFCDFLNSPAKNQLQHIEFDDVTVNSDVYNLLTKCSNLKSLILKGSSTDCISISYSENLPQLPDTLKNFFLSVGTGTDSIRYLKPVELPILMPMLLQMSNLTDLNLCEFCCFNGERVQDICNMENLRNLRLFGGWDMYVNDSLLKTWDSKNGEMFQKLISFEIPGCKGVSDVGAGLLAKKAVNLEILNFELAGITDSSVLLLADVAKKLRKANFVQNDAGLVGEKAILSLIEKAVCLKQLTINSILASKVLRNKNFLPFVEDVEIFVTYSRECVPYLQNIGI